MKAEWGVDRAAVPEGGTLTATLTVQGATNPHEVVRPDLGKLPEFAARFQVENVPGPPVPSGAKAVAFVYRLRPRNRDVTRLPTLRFVYDTGAKAGDPFQTTTAKGVDITVTAAPKPKPPAVALVEPDHLFAVATGPDVLRDAPPAPGPWAWLALAAAGPLAACGWLAVWRRVYPDAARLARARRSRAGRRAVADLRRAARGTDLPAAVAAAVAGYARARFPLPPGAETPAEVGDGLRTAGLPDAEAVAVVALLRRCDAARFAPPGDNAPSLAADAEALVLRLEAAE